MKSGGSTGTPLGFYYERGVSRAIEWAFIKALWDRIGYHFADKCIVLRGQSLGPDRLWQPTFFGRWLTLSSYRMTDQYLPGTSIRSGSTGPGSSRAIPHLSPSSQGT